MVRLCLRARSSGSGTHVRHARARDTLYADMNGYMVHCVTLENRVAVEINSAAEYWDVQLTVGSYAHIDEALEITSPSQTDVAVIDVDLTGDRTEELLEHLRALRSIVVGSPGSEDQLSRAHALNDSEFLLKDEHGSYAILIPTLLRKLLREEDREETVRDIIRSSEERYRNLIDALPDIVYKIDPDGYFTFVNRSVGMLGYEPSELIGRHFTTIIDEAEIERISRRTVLSKYRDHSTGAENAPGLFDERRTGERRTRDLEIRLRKRAEQRREGEKPVIASLTSYGEITATGQYHTSVAQRYFMGTVGIIRNISEQKLSQKRLRQLSFAVEQIDTAVCITDGNGGVDYANPSFFRMNGVRPEDAFESQVFELLDGYVQEERPGELKEALSGTRMWEADRILWTRTGDSRWCWLRVYPLFDLEQQMSQYVLFQEDIGERKQRELELSRSFEFHQEVLRVIHHRVGANLKTMFRGEAKKDELERRITAQVYAHELMQQSGNFDCLDLAQYLRGFPDAVSGAALPRVRVRLTFSELELGINVALPLALAGAECLAVLRPDPGARTETFTIELEEHEERDKKTLRIRHPGTDPFAEKSSLSGPQVVVETLLAQIDGELHHDPGVIGLSFRSSRDGPDSPPTSSR